MEDKKYATEGRWYDFVTNHCMSLALPLLLEAPENHNLLMFIL